MDDGSAAALQETPANSPFTRSLWVDLAISCGLVVCFMAVAHAKSVYPNAMTWLKHDFRGHIGAEYDCIARAIRTGRGFSDPFRGSVAGSQASSFLEEEISWA